MAMGVRFSEDITQALEAIYQAHVSTCDASDKPPDGDYRRGFYDCLRAVAAVFGVPVPVMKGNHDPR